MTLDAERAVPERGRSDLDGPEGHPPVADLPGALRDVRSTLEERDERVAELARQAVVEAERNAELQELLRWAHQQLVERDEEIDRLHAQVEFGLRRQAEMRSTRAWRLASRWWRLRERLRL
jgi:hypothetical protein